MAWMLIVPALIYAGLIFYFFAGLFRLRRDLRKNLFSVSVLVPARNEKFHIRDCLQSLWNQTYPRDLFEVWIIDDESTDSTAEIVRDYIKDKPNFHLISHHRDSSRPSFKKQALKFALEKVTGEIVMTIDADSVAQPRWIEKMTGLYEEDTGLVAGVVTFFPEKEKTLFGKLQTLEFAGIVFCGVGAAGNHNPLICNGSNLSYRLKAFQDAGGYQGHEFLPSGDDDLLLQNIEKKTSWKIKYSVLRETVNYTRPVEDWFDFLNQRSRWASKSLYYPKKWLLLLMAIIYFYYLLIIVLFPVTLLGYFPWKIYLIAVMLKIIPELFLIFRALQFLGRLALLKYFFHGQVFQLIYVIIAGVRGFFHRFSWKEDGDAH
ncbi:MAG: glycosyltransferase [Calditrichaeota bacterium]|nr:glycosyltransferase [Calditrichota bacterium]RQV93370.1 MAG: glycosyltransferase [bacterium]RQW05702.1 MAG: glycosyltransferase [Calditrichota bacterium]